MSGAGTQSVSQVLAKTYQLIEKGQHTEARELLEPLLESIGDNPNALWVYIHSLEDQEAGIAALNRLLEIDPAYPGTSKLIEALKRKMPDAPVSLPVTETQPSLVAPPLLPETMANRLETDSEEDLEQEDNNRASAILLLAAVVIVVVLALGVIIALNPGRTTVDTAIPLSSGQTVSLSSELGELYALVSHFEIRDEGIYTISSELGNTLIVSACSSSGPAASRVLSGIMDALISRIDPIAQQVEAIGVDLRDCDLAGRSNIIAARVSDARAYVDGSITKRDFERLWRPIDRIAA